MVICFKLGGWSVVWNHMLMSTGQTHFPHFFATKMATAESSRSLQSSRSLRVLKPVFRNPCVMSSATSTFQTACKNRTIAQRPNFCDSKKATTGKRLPAKLSLRLVCYSIVPVLNLAALPLNWGCSPSNWCWCKAPFSLTLPSLPEILESGPVVCALP